MSSARKFLRASTKKLLRLVVRIIADSSNEGDVALDLFCGHDMKAVYRAIYWLAAAVVLLAGIEEFAGLMSRDPVAWINVAGPVDFIFNLLTLMAGALLLPPVIDRMWEGRAIIGHGVYRLFGFLVLLTGIFGSGAYAWIILSGQVPSAPPINWFYFSVIAVGYILLGLMFFPFCTKRIRKDRAEQAQKSAAP